MKSNYKGNDAPVQGTNDNSIVSKCSMASVGYFEDKFLKHFVIKNARRSPLINRGYYIRAKAMDFAIQLFLNAYTAEKKQIISLGAGFDSSYFRLKDKGALSNTRFLEIDFPDVVRRKAKLINATEHLANLITSNQSCTEFKDENATNDYSLIGCDLTDLKRLEKMLSSVHFKTDSPTLLFSEVVLTYVNKESCAKLIKWAAERFSNSVFLLYEQIHPADAFGIVMKKHFTTLQSPLKCIDSYPTLESQINRFKLLGWPRCNAMDMNEFFYNNTTKEERDRIRKLEPFDEFEEWHLKCAHYTLVGAFSGSCCHLEKMIFAEKKKESEKAENEKMLLLPWRCTNVAEEKLKRFGHDLVHLNVNEVLLTCGFGCSANKHQRLQDGVVINFAQDNDESRKIQSFPLFERSKLFHSIVKLFDGSYFMFGGRESPLKPCLDYGFFKIDAMNHDDNTDEGEETGQGKSILIYRWRDELSSHPSSHSGDVRKKPCPRWRHSATGIFIAEKEYVLIFGGRNEHCFALSDCWLFDIVERTWREIDLESDSGKIQPRHSHSACLLDNERIIISGGLNEDSQPLNLIQILHISGDGFHVQTVSFDEELPARYSHTSHIVEDKLWLVGGVNLCISSQIVAINVRNWQWREYKLQASQCSIEPGPLMLHNHVSFVRNGKEIIIFGGGGNCFSFGTHFNAGLFYVDISSQLCQ